jgi:tetratricopeptide (TPR) repeat protein
VYDKALENFHTIFSFTLRTEEEIFYRTALAQALYESGEFDKAMTELEKVVEINPNYAPSRYVSAHIFHKQGNLQKAIAEIEKYLMIMDGCDQGIPKVEEMKEMYDRISVTT